MDDIKALELIATELSNLKGIQKPPSSYSDSAKYKKDTERVFTQCRQTMMDVNQYAKRINGSMDSLRAAIKDQTVNIQNAIEKALDSSLTVISTVGRGSSRTMQRSVPSNLGSYVKELQQTAKSMLRLEEFMLETENVFAKVQENVAVTMGDIDMLKGYLESWKLRKDENYKEEQARQEREKREREEAERRRREEEERRRKEEEERRRREEEERKRREEEERERRRREEEERRLEEERKRKEEEERLKREEEERKRKEEERKRREEEEKERKRREEEERRLEEERKRKEEEERLKREEEERKRKEEEDRKRREEEERRKREEEARRKRELERQRLEALKREKERLAKEEADRKWRLDHNNWNNKLYKRGTDQVDSDRAYHKNVCCVISTPPSAHEQSSDEELDLECLASDEVDDIIETLNEGEKIASSVVSLSSKKGEVSLEAPVRAFIPYCQITDPGDELVMKVSVNGSDWIHSTPYLPTQAVISEYGSKLLGAEIDKFENAKLVIVARRKCQNIIVDKPGISQFSNYDKNIKIIVPRDAVKEPTELKLAIKPVTDEALVNISKENPDCDNVSSTSSLIIITCQRPLDKDMEIDLIKAGQKSGTGRSYYVYKTLENVWKMAEIEYKGRNQDVSVTLPSGKYKYSLLQLDLPPSVPKDNSLSIAESIYEYLNKSVVRVILRQKHSNPTMAILNCVRRELVDSKSADLDELGYTLGPDVSREFSISEGQRITIHCSGNIGLQDADDGKIVVPFFAYMDTARENLLFEVKDRFKQRDMADYMGNVVCTYVEANGQSRQIVLSVNIPKLERMRSRVKTAAIRFPYFLTSLANFLSWKLAERGHDSWEHFMERLESRSELQKLYRRAKARVEDDSDEKAVCQVVILDWMKTTERQRDKVGPIERALEMCGMGDLRQECHEFVTYQKEQLSDTAIAQIAARLSDDPEDIGRVLELDEKIVKKIAKDQNGDAFDKREACLQAWRTSDSCVRSGTSALAKLTELLNI